MTSRKKFALGSLAGVLFAITALALTPSTARADGGCTLPTGGYVDMVCNTWESGQGVTCCYWKYPSYEFIGCCSWALE
jgi:hypothetical protein